MRSAECLSSEACGLPFRRHFPWNLILLTIFVSDQGDRCWVSGEGGGTEAAQVLKAGESKQGTSNERVPVEQRCRLFFCQSIPSSSLSQWSEPPAPSCVPVSCPWKIVWIMKRRLSLREQG